MGSEISPMSSQNQQVVIGDNIVDFKLVQSIYNEITGKTENIIKRVDGSYEITEQDIADLDRKINQLCAQYNVFEKNCSVTIFYANDCKERFSSFERFSLHNSSSNAVCENIRLEYDFLILLPEIKQPQKYAINIDLSSRVGIAKKGESQHGTSKRLWRYFGDITGIFDVEYVDYTVARNFLTAINEWYDSLKKNKASKFLNMLRDNSHHIPSILQCLTVAVLVMVLYLYTKNFSFQSLESMLSKSVIIFGIIYFSSIFALKMGRISEEALDTYYPISFIQLTKGDSNCITEYKKEINKGLVKFVVPIISAVMLNISSAYLAKLIGIAT